MKLIQILVEGVPGTKGALEYRFEPSLNPWKQKGVYRLETLVELLLTLLYPKTKENEPLGPGKAQRGTVIFEARERTYRLIRDYVNRKVYFAQQEPGGDSNFRDLSNESRFIQETMVRSVRLPSQKLFRSLLVSIPGKTEWVVSNTPRPLEPAAQPEATVSPEERLKGLQNERENIRKAKSSELRMDELQANVFRIDDELRKLVPVREELARIHTEYERYQIYDREGLITPLNLTKLKNFNAQGEKRETDLKELDERANSWTQELEAIPLRPRWKDPMVLSGAIAALVFLIAAGLFRGETLFSVFLALFSACVGLAGYGALLCFRREGQAQNLSKKIRGLDTERAGIEKRYDIETAAIRKFQEIVKEKDPEEILSQIKQWENLKAEKKVAEEALRSIEAVVNENQLKDERVYAQKEISELDKKLSDLPPLSIDPNALDIQIQELEARIAAQKSTSTPSYSTPSPNVVTNADAIGELICAAAELLATTPTELMKQAQKALDANITSVTGRLYRAIQTRANELTSFIPSQGDPIPWVTLTPETKALLYFAVQFTLWQLIIGTRPLPFFLDLISHPPTKTMIGVSLAAARHLSKKAQVIVLGQ